MKWADEPTTRQSILCNSRSTATNVTDNAITLFAMMERGFDTLRAIQAACPSLVTTVVSARDSHVTYDYFDEIASFCREHRIDFRERSEHAATTTRYAIAISWRWLIAADRSELIVLHDSLLPRYRGFGPLVTALINGEPTIGVTALWASQHYDAGDIIAQASTPVTYPLRIQQAIRLTSALYQQLSVGIVRAIADGSPLPRLPQRDTDATYSLWRDDDDYQIDWTRSAEDIRRFVDAVGAPYLGAATMCKGACARVLDAEVRTDLRIENRTPGKVIAIDDGKPVVVCGTGLLKILDLVDDASRVSLLPLANFRVRFS
jgi:methionyl-tRNA formyltransferase